MCERTYVHTPRLAVCVYVCVCICINIISQVMLYGYMHPTICLFPFNFTYQAGGEERGCGSLLGGRNFAVGNGNVIFSIFGLMCRYYVPIVIHL